MVTIVGVRFKRAGKIYYFNPGELKMAAGDGCIVETSRGVEFGEIVIEPRQVPESEVIQPLKQVLRSATPEDYERVETNKRRAQEAFQIALQKISEHGLPMKLLEAEYTLDDSKLIFSFTADGRVDFRELVKDLAAIFRTRIELRQVGVRDEAKLLGGLGPCGRGLCCATFLGDFEPVSIKMAKDQNLSLNPTKISGVCGRLMCCLKYECDTYQCHKQAFGKATPDVPDEFYHDLEGESDYYRELLQEDSIKEVDYQMMLETLEIEKNMTEEEPTKSEKPSRPKRKRPPKKTKQNKQHESKAGAAKQGEKQAADKAGEQAPKKKRRRRRRKPRPKPENKGE